jgi:hypothetical protein
MLVQRTLSAKEAVELTADSGAAEGYHQILWQPTDSPSEVVPGRNIMRNTMYGLDRISEEFSECFRHHLLDFSVYLSARTGNAQEPSPAPGTVVSSIYTQHLRAPSLLIVPLSLGNTVCKMRIKPVEVSPCVVVLWVRDERVMNIIDLRSGIRGRDMGHEKQSMMPRVRRRCRKATHQTW